MFAGSEELIHFHFSHIFGMGSRSLLSDRRILSQRRTPALDLSALVRRSLAPRAPPLRPRDLCCLHARGMCHLWNRAPSALPLHGVCARQFPRRCRRARSGARCNKFRRRVVPESRHGLHLRHDFLPTGMGSRHPVLRGGVDRRGGHQLGLRHRCIRDARVVGLHTNTHDSGSEAETMESPQGYGSF